MFDTHLHTNFSCDAKMTYNEAIDCASKKNMGIIITEHFDLDYPENPLSFVFDFDEYFKTLQPLRSDKILIGIELGLQIPSNKSIAGHIKDKPFDEVIASIHVVDGFDIYNPSFTKDKDKKIAYKQYLEVVLENVIYFDDFDTLGHIDYICRYAAYQDPEIYVQDFYDLWSDICKVIIQKQKALEINTRRFDNDVALIALKDLYKRYQELGGRYVTIGSDAHRQEAIGSFFYKAWDFAQSINLQPVYFKKRKMILDAK